MCDECDRMKYYDSLEKAEEAIQRVRDLHIKDFDGKDNFCSFCQFDNPDSGNWPCPTIKALDGEDPLEGLNE